MDRTEATIRRLLAALPAPGYDLGILNDRGMYRLEAVPESRILRMLPYLKFRNANGAHIYIRPTGESPYTLLDDLTAATLARLAPEDYAPAAVVETSPGSFQAWLRHAQPLSKELGTLAAKTLAERFGADRSAADWRRFGRAPGFTNRKPQHRNPQGFYPFARLTSHTGQPLPSGDALRSDLDALQVGQRRNVPPCDSALPPFRSASRSSFRSPASVRPHGMKAVQPPQIWRSASALTPKDGPSLTLQPHSRATIFPAIQTALARTATSNARLQKRSVGLPKQSFHFTAAASALSRAAGRNRLGFSLHPHPAIPASARWPRARSQVPPSGLSPFLRRMIANSSGLRRMAQLSAASASPLY